MIWTQYETQLHRSLLELTHTCAVHTLQAESVMSAKQTGGSLERVRTATVNLRALTTPAVTDVKQMYQVS
jgi:hypothetical protein